MAASELTYWDYVKAAFHLKVPAGWLGYMPLNKLVLLAFAVLGLGNPGFWFLGIGYEIAYLLFLSGDRRFQAVVRGMRMAEQKRSWEEREQDVLCRLDKNSQLRYQQLVDRCRTILQTEEASELGPGLAGLKSEALNNLLMIFLKLLSLKTRIAQTLAKTSFQDLDTDIKSLTQRIEREPENSPTRRALEGTLEIQKTRLENLTKSRENLKFTETELERIEKQVSLTAEEMAVSKDPERWSAALDGVVKSIQGTSKWMAENSELFDTIEPSPPVDILQVAGKEGVAQRR